MFLTLIYKTDIGRIDELRRSGAQNDDFVVILYLMTQGRINIGRDSVHKEDGRQAQAETAHISRYQ